jgi:hypothetical protein
MGPISAHEQYFLELLNAARANPAAEAKRQGVGLNSGLAAGTISTSPKQPLVMQRQLHWAARLHSRDMLAKKYFEHTALDGRDPSARARAQGFPGGVSENLSTVGFGFSEDQSPTSAVRSGHGSLFRSKGHRANMMADGQAFIGLGLAFGTGLFSPKDMMATQKFASASAARDGRPFITGVAYLDLNKDRFYTPGEGIDGVIVTAPGNPFSARSGRSGGFALPVSENRKYTVHLRVPGVGTVKRSARVNGRNVRLNFVGNYRQPALQRRGPVRGGLQAVTYSITSFAGATRFDLEFNQLRKARSEDAEPGQRRVTSNAPKSRPHLQPSAAAQGTFGFELSSGGSADQRYVELLPLYIPSAKGRIEFQSRLKRENSYQIPKVQVFADGRWRTVWQRTRDFANEWDFISSYDDTGNDAAAFERVGVDLGAFAGKEVRIRFVLDPDGVVSTGGPRGGWSFDDIQFHDVREHGPWTAVRTNRSRRAVFKPESFGDYVLRARVHFGGRTFTSPSRLVGISAP